jgi:hypothetical protein
METTLAIEAEQSQMQPLEVEPQSKLVEEEVKITNLEVGAKPFVVIHNEIIKIVVKQPKTQDVVQ